MPHAHVNGVKLYYEEVGSGPPLVLIMGTGLDHTYWGKQLPAYSRYFRCIALDNRGVGKSETTPAGYTMDALAQDTLELMDALGIPSAHLSGFSMGGSIAIAMALIAPDRVLSLSLHSTSGRLYPSIKARYRALIPILKSGDADLWAVTAAVTAFSGRYIDAHEDQVEEEIALRRERRAAMSAQQVEGLLGHYVAFSTYDPWSRLDEIKAPTLITVGSEDAVTPPEYARDLHRRIRGSELHVIEDAPHRALTFAHGTFTSISLGFLLQQTLVNRE